MKNLITILIVSLILISCGARKVEKSRTQEAINTEVSDNSTASKTADLNIKIQEATKVDNKNETVIFEETFEPINPLLPSIITDKNGNKTILENVKKSRKETVQKNNTKTDISKKTEQSAKIVALDKKDTKEKTDAKKEVEVVKIERKEYSMFNLFWFFILIPIHIILRNKDVILDKIKSFWWL